MIENFAHVISKAKQNGKLIYKNVGAKSLPKQNLTVGLNDINVIDISGNKFTTIPEIITEFQCLEILFCSHNIIRSLSSNIKNLIYLETVDLSCNHLTSLTSSICKLECLKVLLLSSNRLVSLPKTIGNLQCLEELDASCNSLTCLPDEICALRKLKFLNLRHNKLLDVPPDLASLSSVELLDLSDNQLSTIPSDFHRLGDSLQSFKLSGNPLIFPPAKVYNRGLLHVIKFLKTEHRRQHQRRYRLQQQEQEEHDQEDEEEQHEDSRLSTSMFSSINRGSGVGAIEMTNAFHDYDEVEQDNNDEDTDHDNPLRKFAAPANLKYNRNNSLHSTISCSSPLESSMTTPITNSTSAIAMDTAIEMESPFADDGYIDERRQQQPSLSAIAGIDGVNCSSANWRRRQHYPHASSEAAITSSKTSKSLSLSLSSSSSSSSSFRATLETTGYNGDLVTPVSSSHCNYNDCNTNSKPLSVISAKTTTTDRGRSTHKIVEKQFKKNSKILNIYSNNKTSPPITVANQVIMSPPASNNFRRNSLPGQGTVLTESVVVVVDNNHSGAMMEQSTNGKLNSSKKVGAVTTGTTLPSSSSLARSNLSTNSLTNKNSISFTASMDRNSNNNNSNHQRFNNKDKNDENDDDNGVEHFKATGRRTEKSGEKEGAATGGLGTFNKAPSYSSLRSLKKSSPSIIQFHNDPHNHQQHHSQHRTHHFSRNITKKVSSSNNHNQSGTYVGNIADRNAEGVVGKQINQEAIKKFHKIIEAQLHVHIHTKDLSVELSNGIYLCHLAKYLIPNCIPIVHTPSPGQSELGRQKSKRNLENFLETCRRYGVKEENLFSARDVINCNPSSLLQMAKSVEALMQSIRMSKSRPTSSGISSDNVTCKAWRDVLYNPHSLSRGRRTIGGVQRSTISAPIATSSTLTTTTVTTTSIGAAAGRLTAPIRSRTSDDGGGSYTAGRTGAAGGDVDWAHTNSSYRFNKSLNSPRATKTTSNNDDIIQISSEV